MNTGDVKFPYKNFKYITTLIRVWKPYSYVLNLFLNFGTIYIDKYIYSKI